jgi:hypothetical protein
VTGYLELWWYLLCGVAAINVVAWCVMAPSATSRTMLWLSAVYVLGCAFRSVFPMIDVPRTCLHDTWISRIAVGRSVATIAELCFAVQWALLLRQTGPGFAARAGTLIVPLIVVAELCSWGAVLSGNYLLHAVENSLWTLSAALGIVGFVSLRSRLELRGQHLVTAAAAIGGAYIAFMVLVDVPMYLSRWQADATGGLQLADSVRSLLGRCIVDRDWEAWREDVAWLTLYFTVAVWISIALAHVPRLRPRA